VAPSLSFEVATIRPSHSASPGTIVSLGVLNAPWGPIVPKDRVIITNITTKALICWAWAGDSLPWGDFRVSGGPNWISSDRYDIDAKLDDSQVAALERIAPLDRGLQVKRMVQSLLADRFGLVVEGTTVTVPVYNLVVANGGPKLQVAVPGSPSKIEFQGHTLESLAVRGEIRMHAAPVSTLAQWLERDELGRPVVDRTGLKGKYDVDLKWSPDPNLSGMTPEPPSGTETSPPDPSGPSIFTAIQEQLGLKLEYTKGPEEAIVIAHIERPSEN